MPSRSECEEYYGNCALTSVISRRFGWYNLAKILGLPIKKSETSCGKHFEQVALNHLSERRYQVQQMPQNFPYDLLINCCVKVDVKASGLFRGKSGNFYAFNLEKPYCTCDMYMLYLLNDDDSTKDILVVPSVVVSSQTQISVGETKSKYYKYSQKWDYIKQYVEFMSKFDNTEHHIC